MRTMMQFPILSSSLVILEVSNIHVSCYFILVFFIVSLSRHTSFGVGVGIVMIISVLVVLLVAFCV